MGYLDWHAEPGYYNDIVRHFPSDGRVLDLGCGSGWLSKHLAHYVGLDDRRDRSDGPGRRVQADVHQPLPFRDGTFDGVIMKDVIEHLRDPFAPTAEVVRVLKPGGRVFVSAPDAQRWMWDDYTHVRPYTRKGMRRLLEDAGLRVERVGYESVTPGIGIISRWTRRKRRPRTFAALAWLPFIRRNVWATARKDTD